MPGNWYMVRSERAARNPLRWLLLASHVPANGTAGGMVRYAVELATALREREDIALEVVVATDARDFFVDQLGVAPDRVHAQRGGVMARSLAERMGRLGVDLDAFDVVHGTKHLLPRRVRCCALMTVHDLLPLDRPLDFSVAKRRILSPYYLASVDEADALACVSEATRVRLLTHRPGVASRAAVVPLALSSSLVDATAARIDALRDQRFALIVGDASRRKNLRFVASIWAAVCGRVPGALLAVVGPAGWGRNSGLEQLAGLEAQGSVVRLGHVPDAQLRWAYEHAQVVLCPSLLEGFGLPALEGVTFRAPVIASPDPALAEASAGRATVAALDDPRAWVDAVVAAWSHPRSALPPLPTRRWSEVADETVALARRARCERDGAEPRS